MWCSAASAARWRPLAYFSVKLDNTQKRYSTFDQELLACYLAVRHFRWMLEGSVFHILTDHKPLVFALKNQSEDKTAWQLRHLSFITELTSDIL